MFVGNFDGLLYYDRAQWRIIHAPELRRATVVYRDSKNTFWVGGLDYLARLRKRTNGELYLQQVGRKGQFAGEVMEIYEEGASLQFVAGDNNIYEVDVVSLEALRASDEDVILKDITQTEKLDGGLQVKVKRNGGLIIADSIGRELYTITEANGLCSNQVAYVAYDGHGVLWGATANGIFAIELPSVYSYFLPKDGLTGIPMDFMWSTHGSINAWPTSAISAGHFARVAMRFWWLLPAASTELRRMTGSAD